MNRGWTRSFWQKQDSRHLGLSTHAREILDPLWMLPAVGQGALGLECRSDDSATMNILGPLNDAPTRQAVLAERAGAGLGGGCLVPIGARAVIEGDRLTLCSETVLASNGSRRMADEAAGLAADAERIGQMLAERMLEQERRGNCWRCKDSANPSRLLLSYKSHKSYKSYRTEGDAIFHGRQRTLSFLSARRPDHRGLFAPAVQSYWRIPKLKIGFDLDPAVGLHGYADLAAHAYSSRPHRGPAGLCRPQSDDAYGAA